MNETRSVGRTVGRSVGLGRHGDTATRRHDDLALLACLLYATMRFFKRFQRALDAFLAPDDDPVRSSHAIDAGRDTPSPHVDAHDELRETP